MSYESYIRLELLKNDLNGRKLVKLGWSWDKKIFEKWQTFQNLRVRIHTDDGDETFFENS